jgi:hypothetical protein
VKPWLAALNIPAKDSEGWMILKPATDPLTFWALEQGYLKTPEYLNWARNYYGLPVLNSEYVEQPIDRSLWKKVESVANWSPNLLPLQEWDGVIFVGCVEPDEDVKWSFPVSYILCAPNDLKTLWLAYQSQEDGKAEFPSLPKITPVASGPVVASAIAAPAPPPVAPKAPETGDFTLDLDLKIEAPKGGVKFELEDMAPPSLSETRPPKLDLVQSTGLGEEKPPAVAADSGPMGLSLNLAPPPIPAKAPAAKPVVALVEEVALEMESHPKPTAPAETSSAESTGLGFAKKKAPATLDQAHSINEALAWFHKSIENYYAGVIYLAYESNMLRPLKASDNLKPVGDSALLSVDPNKASVFRIVKRTNMPYHGPVVDSELNKSFFESWGFTTYPAVVTALPLMVSGNSIGQILALGDDKCSPQEVLQMLERLTEKLGPALAQLQSKAA